MTAANGGTINPNSPRTFFGKTSWRYGDVHSDGLVDTEAFIQTSLCVLPFFDNLGSAFKFVKYDISGNIESVKKIYETDKDKYKYINEMLEQDYLNKTRRCAEPLLWLKRGLQFTQIFLSLLCEQLRNNDGQENLFPILDICYRQTVKKYHGWMMQKIVFLSWKAAPWRRDLVKLLCLGHTGIEDILVEETEEFLKNMAANLNQLDVLFEKWDLDSNKKVDKPK